MPKLHEVETIRHALAPIIKGHTVQNVTVHTASLRWPIDEPTLRRYTQNRQIQDLYRRGKALLIAFSGDSLLLVHLGMSGRFILRRNRAPLEKHEHVVWMLEDGLELRYRDPRRFGAVLAGPRDRILAHPSIASLGPEPLSARLTPGHLLQRLRGKKQPIKSALLNQHIVAGLGNIYANEALFRARISPLRPAGSLGEEEVIRLLDAVRTVLCEAIEQGGTTLRDYADPEGNAGLFALRLRVYGRASEPYPRCGGAIVSARLAGRNTFWCEKCQK